MIRSDKIVDAVIWLFNLLTFLCGSLEFYGLCDAAYRDPGMIKGVGDFIFAALIFLISGGMVWKTGQWLMAKPSEIYVPGLLAFWVFLFLIGSILLVNAMGSIPVGHGG